MRSRRSLRIPGFSYQGLHRYFLTFCTLERRHHFADAHIVSIVGEQILNTASSERFAVLAYTFMPDHLHLLIEATSIDADARRFMALAKQRSGYVAAKFDGRRLWQRYCHEHVLRDDEAAVDVARYILENPVRAGLVGAPQDYPYSGCPAYTMTALLDAVAWRPARRSG